MRKSKRKKYERRKPVLPNSNIKVGTLIESVVREVAKYYEINPEDIYKKSRKRIYINPRQFVHYFLFDYFHLGPSLIAQNFNMSHAAVLNSVKKIEYYLECYEDWREDCRALKIRIREISVNLDNPDIIRHLAYQMVTQFPEQFAKTDISNNDLMVVANEFKITEELLDMIKEEKKKEDKKKEDKLKKHHTDELNGKKPEQIKIPLDGEETFGI